MSPYLIVGAIFVSALGSLVFSTLTYSIRELSRVRLADFLERRGSPDWLEPTFTRQGDLVFVTAVFRLLFNTAIVLASLQLADRSFASPASRYAMAALLATVVTLFSSVLIPNALTRHSGDAIVGALVRPLHGLRFMMFPITKLAHLIDELTKRAVGSSARLQPEQIEQEILSVVEAGEKEGVVDGEEREMIESVIQFHDTSAGQIMTSRPEIVGLELTATLAEVKQTLEESGHSRLPVYEGTLDHITGILYARDLMEHIGQPAARFHIRSAVRPAFFVPESKPLRDLLHDFKLQKVHIAIVLDEYGGTAGLITIEDVLEELVGDISDEHEPVEPAMYHWETETIADADARIYIDEFNRLAGLNLPEDDGYDTLGGFVSTQLGRIPETGTVFEYQGTRFTVLDAEPQKVNRVKIELLSMTPDAEGAKSRESAPEPAVSPVS